MLDVTSIIIGILITIAIIIAILIFSSKNKINSVQKIDSDIVSDLVDETPHCPDCGSFDITLIDNCDGLPWLKPYTTEIDYYQCNRCARRFSDEEWQDAKHYDN